MLDPWLIGEDLTAITITPLAKAANGNLVAGAPQVLTDCILEADPTTEVELENIKPVNCFNDNFVPTGQGTSMRLVCLQKSVGANILTALHVSYRYFLVNWTQGGEVQAFKGTTRRWNGGVKNRGANPVSLELAPIAEGDNPNLAHTAP